MSPDGNSVKHVFDITDTRPGFGHEFDEPPYIWQVEPEDFQNVSERLNQAYGVSGNLGVQVAGIARDFAQRLEENGDSLYANAQTPEDRKKITDLLSNSAEYYLRARCGLEIRAEDFNFESISELDADTVTRLGNVVNNFSRQVLDNVERVVRTNNERRKLENGREGLEQNSADSLSNQLYDGRGAEPVRGENIDGTGNEAGRRPDDLSGIGTDGSGETGLAGGDSDEGERGRNDLREDSGRLESVPNAEAQTTVPAADEIRSNAPEILGGVESSDSVGVGRESSDSLLGDSGTGESNEARTDEPVRTERPAAGQKQKSDGLGATHEQPRHASRRNRVEQPDLQLGFDFSAAQENAEESENIAATENADTSKPEALNEAKEALIVSTPKTQSQEIRNPSQPRINYRITDDDLGVGGAKTKFKNNVEAIRILKKIESEDRRATTDEQEILSHYVGWGGIPQAIRRVKKSFDRRRIQRCARLNLKCPLHFTDGSPLNVRNSRTNGIFKGKYS